MQTVFCSHMCSFRLKESLGLVWFGFGEFISCLVASPGSSNSLRCIKNLVMKKQMKIY